MGLLFPQEARGLKERRDARRASLEQRIAACAAVISSEPSEQWLVWGDLNAETEGLTKCLDDAVEVRGPDEPEDKERALLDFADGRIRILVSKTSIAGFGMNYQNCARMAFIGISDSYESFYQAVRRCWRFGQSRPVRVHLFASESERSVVDNLRRKEIDAQKMADELSAMTRHAVRESVLGAARKRVPYEPKKRATRPTWMRGLQ